MRATAGAPPRKAPPLTARHRLDPEPDLPTGAPATAADLAPVAVLVAEAPAATTPGAAAPAAAAPVTAAPADATPAAAAPAATTP
ncbi:MAG: hypothetical protein NTW05_15270, partial [Pseudonocardiales bacterium]|nr:hypothetical protein [Pseudonocardiales bacterium]